ncbi:MAG: ribosomal-processing cysteine protease Prp [Spirochaetes bacterium]|nr:ribosomal-processing cysteine protease Prp [Spirochaetota bacterium]
MIEFSFLCDNKKNVIGFEVSGHSGSAQKGYDLVCASVTTLVQTAVSALKDELGLVLQIKKGESGYLKCIIEDSCTVEIRDKVNFLFKTLEIGLGYLTKAGKDQSAIIYDFKKI